MKLKILDKKELSSKIAVLVGTRPGIIKFSPIIRALNEANLDTIIIHASQHYSHELDGIFFKELELPKPSFRVLEMKKTYYHGEQTARMLNGIEKVLLKEKPKVVIVGGDANTNLAGALATRKLGINLIHLEAGLRSNDWRMPEEHNRVMIDHISDILLAPTKKAENNLKSEGVKGKIFLVGNVISDVVNQNKLLAKKKSNILKKLQLKNKNYILVTLHREENVDKKKILENLCASLNNLTKEISMPIVFPIHPRTKNRIKLFKIQIMEKNIKLIQPLGYFDFLNLLENCAVVLTDSGGIQEEACILKIPCLTLRDNTERPETVSIGANTIVGHKQEKILKETKKVLKKKKNWKDPYGTKVAEKILKIIKKEYGI